MVRNISDGATFTPTDPMHIGMSNDNLQFDLLSKQGLTIGTIWSVSPGLNYPYPTKTILVLTDITGNKMMCELQDINNGDLVAFNTGTKASLQTAAKTVGHWITSI